MYMTNAAIMTQSATIQKTRTVSFGLVLPPKPCRGLFPMAVMMPPLSYARGAFAVRLDAFRRRCGRGVGCRHTPTNNANRVPNSAADRAGPFADVRTVSTDFSRIRWCAWSRKVCGLEHAKPGTARVANHENLNESVDWGQTSTIHACFQAWDIALRCCGSSRWTNWSHSTSQAEYGTEIAIDQSTSQVCHANF